MPDLPDWTAGISFASDPIIYNLTGLLNPLTPGGSVAVSLAQYSSLIIVASSAANLLLKVEFHQSIAVGGASDTTPFTEYLTSIDPAQTPTWIIPIAAGSVQVTNLGTANVDIVGYGSTRTVPKPLMLGNTSTPRQFSLVGAATSGTLIVPPAFDSGPLGTNFNGPIYVRASSTIVTGLFGYQSVGPAGDLRRIYVGQLIAGGAAFTMCSHPLGIVRWIILPQSTSATSNVAIDITQA